MGKKILGSRENLTTYQLNPDAHNFGIGKQNYMSLTTQRTQRVNHDNPPLFRFLGRCRGLFFVDGRIGVGAVQAGENREIC